MNVLIIEDEQGAAQNLIAALKEIDSSIHPVAVIESVRDALAWIKNNPAPDLAFFDIRLADGNSFQIFEQTDVPFPIVFTTAYDQYAIQAFKVNSIDYLLKPVRKADLEQALQKFRQIYKQTDFEALLKVISQLDLGQNKPGKRTFLIHYQDRLIPIETSDFAYFYIRNGIVYGVTFDKQKYIIDQKLDRIEAQVDADNFFRVNRQYIVSRKAIKEAAHFFNGRLKLKVNPAPEDVLLISKAKAPEFKAWLGG